MKSLAQTYRIATSLSIAVARLREIVATVPTGPDLRDVVLFAASVRAGDERACLTWQWQSISTTFGVWRVSIERDRAAWQHKRISVIITPDGMAATGGSETRCARAMRIVERRAAQLEHELFDLKRARVFVDVIAVAPTEVLVIVNAIGAASVEAFRKIDHHINTLWPTAKHDEAAGAMLRGYPIDADDARLIDAGLSPEDRELIARVNRGETAARIARGATGYDDPNKTNALNQRISRLRKRHPELIRPAQKRAGRK